MKRIVASLLSVALLMQTGAAFAASETLELPFGGPPPRATVETAQLESGDGSEELIVVPRKKVRSPQSAAGGRWSGRQDGIRDRAEGPRGGGKGARGSRGGDGSGTPRAGAVGGRS
jgi:hypothetical protein